MISEEVAVHWRVVWVSLLVFTGVCVLSPLDISIRHFSVPTVLLILLLAPLPRILGAGLSLGGVVVAALAAACLFTVVHAYPYYFPFINLLSMGRPAHTLVNDSNVDWDQSLPEVKRFAEQHGLQKLPLDDYGFADPAVFVPAVLLAGTLMGLCFAVMWLTTMYQLWFRSTPEPGGQASVSLLTLSPSRSAKTQAQSE